jgi:hypothetical protein
MATHTRYFRWDDPGAPTLSGTAGSLLDILRACLVGTAGVAYGTGATEKLAAGWTEEFTGTNVAAFRNSLAAGGTGGYLRVDDSSAQVALLRSFGSMSDLDTGVGPMPLTSGTFATGAPVKKSESSNATARPWILLADERTFYLHIWPSDRPLIVEFYGGGDGISFLPAEGLFRFLVYRASYSTGDTNQGYSFIHSTSASSVSANADQGLQIATGYLLTGDPVDFQVRSVDPTSFIGGSGCMSDPSPGGLRYYQPSIVYAENIPRGRLPGLYVPQNDLRSVANGSVDAGAAGLPAGSELVLLLMNKGTGNNNGNVGVVAVESVLEWS